VADLLLALKAKPLPSLKDVNSLKTHNPVLV